MTDKQIALFIDKYAKILERAISNLEYSLPEDLKVEYKTILGGKGSGFKELDELKELLSYMNDDVEELKKNKAV